MEESVFQAAAGEPAMPLFDALHSILELLLLPRYQIDMEIPV
jgi:hypothetical protein